MPIASQRRSSVRSSMPATSTATLNDATSQHTLTSKADISQQQPPPDEASFSYGVPRQSTTTTQRPKQRTTTDNQPFKAQKRPRAISVSPPRHTNIRPPRGPAPQAAHPTLHSSAIPGSAASLPPKARSLPHPAKPRPISPSLLASRTVKTLTIARNLPIGSALSTAASASLPSLAPLLPIAIACAVVCLSCIFIFRPHDQHNVPPHWAVPLPHAVPLLPAPPSSPSPSPSTIIDTDQHSPRTLSLPPSPSLPAAPRLSPSLSPPLLSLSPRPLPSSLLSPPSAPVSHSFSLTPALL